MKFINLLKNEKVLEISNLSRISYRSDINGLRAVAVLAVVLYHAEIEYFNGGWIGVDVFFVISGFLISNIIISELNENKFSFKKFYLRRVRRILPALFSTVLLSLPLSYLLLTPKAMLEFSRSITSSLLFYSNYYFQNLDFYNSEPTKVMPLLHTWSLAIEEQFYIVFPLLCFLIFKFFRKYFFVFLLTTFLISLFLNSTTSELIKFYQIQFRGWELLLGALVMIFRSKVKINHLNYLGISLVLFAIFYFDDSMMTLNSVEPRLVGVVGSGLILASSGKNFIFKTLSNKYLSVIGISSYSIYLFHQPMFAFYRLFQERYSLINKNLSTVFILFALMIFSYLNWKYVEIYFQKNTQQVLLLFIICCLSISFLFVYFSSKSSGFEARYDYVPEEVLFYSRTPNIYPSLFDDKDYLFKNKDCDNSILTGSYCEWYDTKADSTIYLVGDSQTNALSVSFLKNLTNAQKNYNLVFITNTAGRCVLSQQSDTVGYVEYCTEEFFNEFINIINKEKDIVIAFGRFDTWLTQKGQNEIKCLGCDYIVNFRKRLETISKHSYKFVIIEPIPTYNFSIADSYLYRKKVWGEPITLDLNKWQNDVKQYEEFLSSMNLKNINFIPSIPIFCSFEKENLCYASSNNKLYYSDSNHLTLDGANLITQEVNNFLSSIRK